MAKERHLLHIKDHPKSACYVLITCDEPNAEGKMHVEMTYQGDPALAAFLLANAQGFIDEDIDEQQVSV